MLPAAEDRGAIDRAETPRMHPARRLIVAGWLLVGLAALLALLTLNVRTPGALSGASTMSAPARAFDLETLDGGGRLSLAELRGSPVVINFWASWCVPCRDEAPLLADIAQRYRSQGLRVVGIVYQDDGGAAREFMTRYGLTYPALLDPEGRTAIDYGVLGIPETFFVDRDGIMRFRQIGPVSQAQLPQQVAEILR